MRVITFVTQKGGTGKTSLATSLAVAAIEAGETVVLLDLDPQETATEWGRDREKAQTKAEKSGKMDEAAKLEAPHVQAFPMARIAELPALVRGLKGFSLVIIDTPGVDSATTHIAMDAADFCLVPIQPSKAEVKAMLPTIQALLRGRTPFAMILNRCLTIPKNSRAPEMAAGLQTLGMLANPLIFNRTAYQDALGSGLGVTEYEHKGAAAEEIRALWQSVDELSQQHKKRENL